ncbi:MAG: M50 family metallopeptidase [Myxococcota bacterium]
MSIIEILSMLVGLSILVITHESGHYLAARAFGMKVLRYSIGFGPTLFKHKPKGSDTTFQVAAIPFLAYVQIAGMNPYEEHEEGEQGLFNDQSAFARIVTVAAGPFANYLTAAILAFAIGLAGWPSRTFHALWPDDPRAAQAEIELPPIAGPVSEDSAAEATSIQEGDVFVRVGETSIETFQQLQEATQATEGAATPYVVRRGEEELTLTVTPRMNDGSALIGVRIDEEAAQEAAMAQQGPPVELGVGEAATMAFAVPAKITVYQLRAIGKMIANLDSSGLGGPVEISRQFGKAAQVGPMAWFVMVMMMSVALGLFNLLPFPALDGGRLIFLFFEVITRRKPNERFEALVHTVGIVILLVVIALVTVRDIAG